MARIQLETTQNVLLEFDLAGAGDRIVAGLLDWIFIGAYGFICFLIFFVMLSINTTIASSTGLFIFVVLIYLPVFLYHLIFEIFLNGQSPGKKVMKIKVIRLDGSQPALGDYIIRWLFRIVDSIFLYSVAIVAIVVTRKEQRIGDIVANTTVIKLKKRATLQDTILQVVEHNYKPYFSDVLRFSDKDINTIKEALEIYKKNNNPKHIDKLAAKVKEIMRVNDPQMSSVRILQTLIKDYNFYNYEK
jgi:uncharacterized RDD family membrane protein YckC